MFLLADAAGDATSLVSPLEQVVRSLDANLPVSNLRTVNEFYRLRVVTILNVIRTLIGAMGIMGLALALVGLYGLVAYAANRRTKEIGIRMAIGANRWDVVRMVLRQGTSLAVAGLLIGLVASVGADRALAAMFTGGPGGDNRTDVAAYVLVAVTVLAVTLLAAYVPARRAARVNPTDALRCE
jgi:ABC-type antimicrobial peptide transport system permease subunit